MEDIDLSEAGLGISSEIFDILFKWLYSGQIPVGPPSTMQSDEFWALVFRMSELLVVPELGMMAFQKFEACFPISAISSANQNHVCLSKGLSDVLFKTESNTGVLQSWSIDYIFWVYECVPSALKEIANMIELYPVLASGFCARLFRRELTCRTPQDEKLTFV